VLLAVVLLGQLLGQLQPQPQGNRSEIHVEGSRNSGKSIMMKLNLAVRKLLQLARQLRGKRATASSRPTDPHPEAALPSMPRLEKPLGGSSLLTSCLPPSIPHDLSHSPFVQERRLARLEADFRDLGHQVHAHQIEDLIDLKIAVGLITEKERTQSTAVLMRIPVEALRLMRLDLLKVLTRLVASASSESQSPSSVLGGKERYVI